MGSQGDSASSTALVMTRLQRCAVPLCAFGPHRARGSLLSGLSDHYSIGANRRAGEPTPERMSDQAARCARTFVARREAGWDSVLVRAHVLLATGYFIPRTGRALQAFMSKAGLASRRYGRRGYGGGGGAIWSIRNTETDS
jgi:hypothetical protein